MTSLNPFGSQVYSVRGLCFCLKFGMLSPPFRRPKMILGFRVNISCAFALILNANNLNLQ